MAKLNPQESQASISEKDRTVAYFSMEIGVDPAIPTYSGGLGVLAGDTIRAAADLDVPMVAFTLLYRKGYFYQKLDPSGWQREEPVEWVVEDYLEEMAQRVSVTVEGRSVYLRSWKYGVKGYRGATVPVYFLDADLPENSEWDRTITHSLYGGDKHYRLCQEVVLGIGGVKMLRALGFNNLNRFHMNEGHASLLTLELLDERVKSAGRNVIKEEDVEAVKKLCVFTTHTPVPAGHDQFSMDLVERVLGHRDIYAMKDIFCCDGVLNMTYLALNLSHYVNGVAKKHGEVSRHMFSRYVIHSITNGVHVATWASRPFQDLFDRFIPDWRKDSFSLRYALNIPGDDVLKAHKSAKETLIEHVNRETNAGMECEVLTLGFARRAATYKRADLLFTDVERLRRIASKGGAIQVIYAGKAHPQDQGGKELIKKIFQYSADLKKDIKVTYLKNYDMDLGKMLTAGVDIWLNTPQPPLEASGTSGMKAALNGVPSLSIRDGWWIEGHIEGITGWSIGADHTENESRDNRAQDAASLYDKLERVIVPMFYKERNKFMEIMRHALALNGSFFNTQRMMQQYVTYAYFR